MTPVMNAELTADYLVWGGGGKQILEIMNTKQMTRREPADHIGKSRQYVSRIVKREKEFYHCRIGGHCSST
jgi:hypothetical protein